MDTTMFIFWLISAVVLSITEALTATLITIWFVLGAVAAMIAAYFGLNYGWQLLLFVVVSLIALIVTRPLARKIFSKNGKIRTNSDRIIGRVGVVTVDIDNPENQGQIKILGQIWPAKSENDQQISVGENVRVRAIEGDKAVVIKAALEVKGEFKEGLY